MGLQCFYLERIERTRLSLRRFTFGNDKDCPGNSGGHNGQVFYADVDERCEPGEGGRRVFRHSGPQNREEVSAGAVWPMKCDSCPYIFTEDDQWQVFSDSLYRRTDTGEVMTWRDAGPGAMRNCEWLVDLSWAVGPDGLALSVKCPNGREWHIDGPANNCTKPDDKIHKCWCRHGTPPMITVDKNCSTCAAGAGSIQAGDYHGFLRNGEFTNA